MSGSSPLDDFMDYVSPEPTTGCWLWTGVVSHRYGSVPARLERLCDERRAHRWAWVWLNGPIPMGLGVLHRCDNPPCVNPAHLFLGTHADNMRDMVEKGRCAGNSAKPGSEHHAAKMDEDLVACLRFAHWSAGVSIRALAEAVGVTWGTLRDALTGFGWKHVSMRHVPIAVRQDVSAVADALEGE